jgi:hypothetical protein
MASHTCTALVVGVTADANKPASPALSVMSDDDAAVAIQASYRGYTTRKSDSTLRKVGRCRLNPVYASPECDVLHSGSLTMPVCNTP